MKTSSYKTHWVEFFPTTKSIVTIHDRKAFGEVILNGTEKTHRKHFGSKQDAIDYLLNFNKGLDDRYRCLIFTDRQFANATREDDFAIHYTKKQLAEEYFIG